MCVFVCVPAQTMDVEHVFLNVVLEKITDKTPGSDSEA